MTAWSPALTLNWEKGEPEAKMTVPSVQLTACSKVHSALVSGVAEREQDGAAAEPAGVDRGLERAHDRLGKDAERGRQAHERRRLDVLDHLLERAELVAVVVGARKVLLVVGQLVAAVLGHEALGVNQPELVARRLLRQAAARVVLDHLLGHAHAGRARAHEHQALLLYGARPDRLTAPM